MASYTWTDRTAGAEKEDVRAFLAIQSQQILVDELAESTLRRIGITMDKSKCLWEKWEA